MGIGQSLRKLTDRARGKVRPEQAESGIDKVADKFNQATGGRYGSRVDKGRQKAKDTAKRHLQS